MWFPVVIVHHDATPLMTMANTAHHHSPIYCYDTFISTLVRLLLYQRHLVRSVANISQRLIKRCRQLQTELMVNPTEPLAQPTTFRCVDSNWKVPSVHHGFPRPCECVMNTMAKWAFDIFMCSDS